MEEISVDILWYDNTDELKPLIVACFPGGITDIEIGPDGLMYVVEFREGAIYKLLPRLAIN